MPQSAPVRVSSVFVVAAGRAYAALAAGFILIVSAKWLGPSDQGALVATISWVAIVAQVVCLSFPQVLPFQLQASTHRNSEARRLAPVLLRWALVQAAIGAFFIFVLLSARLIPSLQSLSSSVYVLATLLLCVLLLDEYFRGLCIQLGDLPAYNLALIVGRTAGVICLGAALIVDGGITAFAFAYLVAYITPLLLLVRRIGSYLSVSTKDGPSGASDLASFFSSGIKLLPNTLATHLLLNSGVLVGSLFLSTREIGWFQLGLQLVALISLFPQSFSAVMFGRIAVSTPDTAWFEQRRIMRHVLLFVLALVVVGLICGRWLIERFLGGEWSLGASVTLSLLPVAISLAFAQSMTPQWLGRGLFGKTSTVTVMTAALNTFLSLCLMPSYGVWGLVYSCWICLGLLTFVVQLRFFFFCNRSASIQVS